MSRDQIRGATILGPNVGPNVQPAVTPAVGSNVEATAQSIVDSATGPNSANSFKAMSSALLGRWRLPRSVMSAFSILLVAMAFTLLASSFSRASDEDSDDDGAKTTHSARGEKSLRRQYNGGRDEEELTVQAVLSQPVRSPDGVPGAADANAGAHD